MKFGLWTLSIAVLVGVAACDSKPAQSSSAASSQAGHAHNDDLQEEHHHTHKAPRGGVLVELGEEFAHLEVLTDPKLGQLDVYLLDAHAENAVRSKQGELDLTLTVTKYDREKPLPGKSVTLILTGVASELAGETANDTSHYSGRDDTLIGAAKFDVVLKLIAAKGQEFADVKFHYPAGNE